MEEVKEVVEKVKKHQQEYALNDQKYSEENDNPDDDHVFNLSSSNYEPNEEQPMTALPQAGNSNNIGLTSLGFGLLIAGLAIGLKTLKRRE